MSWLCSGQLFRSNIAVPLVQTLRYRSRRPNLRRPAIPHWHRAVMKKVTEPQYLDPLKEVHPKELCNLKIKTENKQEKINPFEQILAREFLEEVESAKMIAIFHCCSMSQAELYALRLQLVKIGLYYQCSSNTIAKLAFTGTKYEGLLHLYQSQTVTFTGDKLEVGKLLKMQKKLPSLILLAVVVEGRLMSLTDLHRYASLPSLHALHGQLVGILSTPSQRLSQNLAYHQTELSSSLSRYISDYTSGSSKEEISEKEETTS